jgi:alpha-amylase/alpha-mannosidase (GH57 family)
MKPGKAHVLAAIIVFGFAAAARAQPVRTPEGVRFTYRGPALRSVSVAGDFNSWSKDVDTLTRGGDSTWSIARSLGPGLYQYKFLVDGTGYLLDPGNPAVIDNFNRSAKNSVFVLTQEGEVLLTAEIPGASGNPSDQYPNAPGRQPVFLNIIWHQHQPLYANPVTDQLAGPWVRTHATKDYYDMAAMLRRFPAIHCTVNLTSSLLHQLREFYLARLGPSIDARKGVMDVAGFWKKWKGKTDPWIDLALTPAAAYTEEQRGHLYRNAWSAFGVSEVMIERFPEYKALRDRLRGAPSADEKLFTQQEQREILFWFYLANFDPDFLRGAVKLPGGSVCDLREFVEERSDGTFHLRRRITDEDCVRMVVESYKVMAAVIPVHRGLRYDPQKHSGQIDIITTPFYHPILPLLFDSDLARMCQPRDPLPSRFAYPQDAEAQVVKAIHMYRDIFGASPTGMWPGEGSVAQPMLELLRSKGILWTASDVKVLARSRPPGKPNTTAFGFPAGQKGMAMVFRDTELSDRIGFTYQSMEGELAAEDFVQSILALAPHTGEPEALITVILDGENAWEWYQRDIDGKNFLNALYRKLSKLYATRQVVTVTMSEYLQGNPQRGVPAHPIRKLPSMEWLWPGSWINGNYDTWIGELEENQAWEYLLQAREDLARSGVRRPDPRSRAPRKGTKEWYAYMAWEEMYASEGSDWFWWYGADQTAPAGDTPFDTAYIAHLRNISRFARLAGGRMPERTFNPILAVRTGGSGLPDDASTGRGAMARASAAAQTVLFICDAAGQNVTRSIYVAGGHPALGEWVPNKVAMRDDGLEGDSVAGDGLWTLRISLPAGTSHSYKYTNSGPAGVWMPGDEFPGRNRTATILEYPQPFIIRDTFGR